MSYNLRRIVRLAQGFQASDMTRELNWIAKKAKEMDIDAQVVLPKRLVITDKAGNSNTFEARWQRDPEQLVLVPEGGTSPFGTGPKLPNLELPASGTPQGEFHGLMEDEAEVELERYFQNFFE